MPRKPQKIGISMPDHRPPMGRTKSAVQRKCNGTVNTNHCNRSRAHRHTVCRAKPRGCK